jgi:hypothetical protein
MRLAMAVNHCDKVMKVFNTEQIKSGIPYRSLQYNPARLNLCGWLKEGNAAEIKLRKYDLVKQ